jgi:hypothetical protein
MPTMARIRTVFTGVAGAPWYSNMYFDADAVSGGDYAAFVADFWVALQGIQHQAVDWVVQPEFAVIESTTGLIVDVGTWAGESGGGTNVVEPLPWANQAIVHWFTGVYLNGRQVRGKTFVPGLTQTSNDAGSLLPTQRATIDAAAEELINDGNGAFVVFSPTNLADIPITSASVPSLIGVLRSRRD